MDTWSAEGKRTSTSHKGKVVRASKKERRLTVGSEPGTLSRPSENFSESSPGATSLSSRKIKKFTHKRKPDHDAGLLHAVPSGYANVSGQQAVYKYRKTKALSTGCRAHGLADSVLPGSPRGGRRGERKRVGVWRRVRD